MNKLGVWIVLIVAAQVSYGIGTLPYDCNFEAGSQGTSFTTGELYGQGIPMWEWGYIGASDQSGYVVSGESYGSGNQALYLTTFYTGTNWVTLDEPTVAPWFEFAFKTAFDGTNPDQYVWMRTISGLFFHNAGPSVTIKANGDVTVHGFVNGLGEIIYKTIGNVSNNEWHTMSIKQNVVYDPNYKEGMGSNVFDGYFDIYIDGNIAERNFRSFSAGAYQFLQTIVFSSASFYPYSRLTCGTWYIDDIHVGEKPVFACGALEGDISGPAGVPDCRVDFYDFGLLANRWQQDIRMQECPGLEGDISGPLDSPDCNVDLYDLKAFAEQWLLQNVLE